MTDVVAGRLWADQDLELVRLVDERRAACLDVYKRDPARVREDARKERATAEGGYGRKQILELVQNASDAMLDDPGRIEVRLTREHLYVANQGSPFSEAGVIALLYSHLSGKSDEEIGRFGLGFKSVAAISTKPQIFSRSVSFGFDGPRALEEISGAVPGVAETPSLRLAWPLSPRDEAAADAVLAQQMSWATTIIKIPVGEHSALVADDMREFPGWFVLFARHVQQIELIDTESGTHRTITISSQGSDGYALSDSAVRDASDWKVFERSHRPSEKALSNAGVAARRQEIKVSWAVQLGSRSGIGQLSAFFPINESTTLSGMINAPWKLSDDRSSLIEGDFNREILEVVLPEIVASALPHLVDKDHPGRLLDLLPARGREPRGWADAILNQPIYAKLSTSESLPDLRGVLRRPKTMRMAPEKITPQLHGTWALRVAKPERWIHPNAISSPERRSKALRLITDANGTVATPKDWLLAALDEVTPMRSAAAIHLATQLRNSQLMNDREMKTCRIVLLENGDLEVMQAGRVYLRGYDDEQGSTFVHAEVVSDAKTLELLKAEGISTYDRGGELHKLLLEMRESGSFEWDLIWSAMRTLPADKALEIIENDLGKPPVLCMKVKSGDGTWVPPYTVLLPGGAISAPKGDDRKAVVDIAFHRPDQDALSRLGLNKNLRSRGDIPAEQWVATYKRRIAEQFIAAQSGSKPSPDKLVLTERPVMGPLELLPELSASARVSITEAVLTYVDRTAWNVRHTTNATYGNRPYAAPEISRIRDYGLVSTGYGPLPLRRCLSPYADRAEQFARFVPVVSDRIVPEDDIKRLKLKSSIEDFSVEDWEWMIEKLVERDDSNALTLLYANTTDLLDPPEKLQVRSAKKWSAHKPEDVAVVADADTFTILRDMSVAAILVEDTDLKAALIENWGLFDGREALKTDTTFVPEGESTVLVDVYPPLRIYLHEEAYDYELQKCSEIRETIFIHGRGAQERTLPQHVQSKTVLVTASDDVEVLTQVANALDIEALDRRGIRDLLTQMEGQRVDEHVAAIRYAHDDTERLLLAVGQDGLRAIVRRQALEAIESDIGRELTGAELVKLCMDLYGFGTLRKALKTVDSDSLNPPTTWGGRSTARRWVKDLGFAPDWAGEPSQVRRDAMLRVDGPVELQPLHDYQRHIANALRRMIGGEGPARGLISLPTGAGKTRVAVQGVIESAVEDGALNGPIIWIAESDELCEQAVDTWTYLWRAMGQTNRPLAISRFWSNNSVAEEPGSFQVVIASRQKLINVVHKTDLAWLTDAEVVIVDEAHSSVATSYTTILDWLGRGRSRQERRLLLGLTATPFRNSNDVETDRLAARYDRNRLDRDAFGEGEGADPYTVLQQMKVLAKVSQRELEGTELTLSAAEASKLENLAFFPSWAEQRVGDDEERNDRIIQSIKELPEDFPVLLFAASVENAEVLAALLSYEGVSAAAISANTPDDERAAIIARFKAGELRVITNYNVLAQGFDAPAVRAVYITRPTYSPGLYQQMIGRGLRGPLNQGSEEVLIVNVRDNIVQYGETLAFYEFEQLWNPEI